MGCDIHLYLERKVRGKWICLNPLEWDIYGFSSHSNLERAEPYTRRTIGKVFRGRTYELFGWLAQVRTSQPNGFQPRGFPKECSEAVLQEYEAWRVDAHDPSFLNLSELKDKFSGTVRVAGMMDTEQLDSLMASIRNGTPNWDLLYPYCGWSSGKNYERFALDVPMKWLFRRFYRQVICEMERHTWSDVGGEPRIVFWFDS